MNYREIVLNKISALIKDNALKVHNYKAKEIVFNEGDKCEYLGFILKGKINISIISFKNVEESINLVEENDFFGQYLLFQNNARYLGDVIALKATSIVLISKEILLNNLMADKEFLNAYISIISNESFKIKQQIKLLSHKKAIDRIIFYLENNNINNIVNIDSITSLSKTLNLPRETVSRIISKLILEGKIKKQNNVIELLQ